MDQATSIAFSQPILPATDEKQDREPGDVADDACGDVMLSQAYTLA